ncbi:MAG: hypothetical protein KC431_29390, partial [Myxococcales bacterium]|nr:hypothetical protein [Myxococcales bacterium]
MSSVDGFAALDPAMLGRLTRSVQAGLRALLLLTDEDERARALVDALGRELSWPVHHWSAAAGVDHGGRERELSALLAALYEGRESVHAEDGLWLLHDVGPLRGADRRRLREL